MTAAASAGGIDIRLTQGGKGGSEVPVAPDPAERLFQGFQQDLHNRGGELVFTPELMDKDLSFNYGLRGLCKLPAHWLLR